MPDYEGWRFLGEILLLLGGAVALGALLESFGISAVIGYLITGVVMGPGLLGLIDDTATFEVVAELGVALLLFSIGLEMTPAKLRGFGLRGALVGLIQVLVTVVVGTLCAWLFGYSIRASIVLGCVIAMSSTAVVVRLLVDRGELDAPRGREALSVLLAQDVAVVPMLIAVGLLGSTGTSDVSATERLTDAALGLLLMVAAMAAIGILVLPRLLGAAVFRTNRDFAIVIAIITCMAAAWASHALGLSPALGAFLAGLILARVSFSRQIRADTGALRAVFLTLFFTSIGLLANIHELLETKILITVGVILILGLLIKLVVTWFAIRITGGNRVTAIGAAFCLAQFGEFSFVVGTEAQRLGVIDDTTFQSIVGASLLSLLATPLLVSKARPMALGVNRVLIRLGVWNDRPHLESETSETLSEHVVVIGFGPAGQEAARTVRLAGLEPVILELNPHSVKLAIAEGMRAVQGDSSHHELLSHVHAHEAKAFVVTIPDPEMAISTLHQIRSVNRDAIVVVRGRYARRLPELESAGADHVLSEEATIGTLLGATVVARATGIAKTGEETWPAPSSRIDDEQDATASHPED